jgi:hypothetical protein
MKAFNQLIRERAAGELAEISALASVLGITGVQAGITKEQRESFGSVRGSTVTRYLPIIRKLVLAVWRMRDVASGGDTQGLEGVINGNLVQRICRELRQGIQVVRQDSRNRAGAGSSSSSFLRIHTNSHDDDDDEKMMMRYSLGVPHIGRALVDLLSLSSPENPLLSFLLRCLLFTDATQDMSEPYVHVDENADSSSSFESGVDSDSSSSSSANDDDDDNDNDDRRHVMTADNSRTIALSIAQWGKRVKLISTNSALTVVSAILFSLRS